MLVHLLRHGETEGGARYWGWTDVALSTKGWEQMRAAVAAQSWELIVSSPLRRCAAFAAALAEERGVACRYEADLREMSFGDWEGRSAAELMHTDAQRLRRFWSDPSAYAAPGGESLAQLHSRVMAAWRRVVSDPNRRRVLIVTHGGPVRILRAAQTSTPLSALLGIDVPHGSLFGIECDADGSFAPGSRAPTPCLAEETH